MLTLTAADGTTDNAAYTYDPYGVTLTAAGTLATTNPYRYATSYYDAATGLYKLGERYYNPSLGRFTQLDPSGREANLYAYAGDDPANSEDASGMTTSFTFANGSVFLHTLHFNVYFNKAGTAEAVNRFTWELGILAAALALITPYGPLLAAAYGGYILYHAMEAVNDGMCLKLDISYLGPVELASEYTCGPS